MSAKPIENKDDAKLPAPRPQLAVECVTSIVAAYLSHNQVPMDKIPEVIRTVAAAVGGAEASTVPAEPQTPAVPIKKSIGDDFIICLEDGKKLTMLKRYLRSQYNMSPEDYRRKWGLPHDYPMVSPAYAKLRSAFAKKIGLGKVPQERRGRQKKA